MGFRWPGEGWGVRGLGEQGQIYRGDRETGDWGGKAREGWGWRGGWRGWGGREGYREKGMLGGGICESNNGGGGGIHEGRE